MPVGNNSTAAKPGSRWCLFSAYRPEGDVRFKRKAGETSPLCTLQSRANRDGSPTL
jgi:hypothetical protein